MSVTLRALRLAEAERDSIALVLADRQDVEVLAQLFKAVVKCFEIRSKLRRRKGSR